MFGDIGAPELLIVLVLVVVLFGAGRIGGLGKDLGTSIKEFRKAMKDEDEPAANPPAQAVSLPQPTNAPVPPIYAAPEPARQQMPPPAAPAGPDQRPPALF